MILTLANVLYVLVAVAMTVLILLQRGAGAAAGSGFGAGASATVFGARGASNFLSKSTAVLAALFFILSLGMAMYATKMANGGSVDADSDLGVMDVVPAASFETPALPTPPVTTPAVTPAPTDVPAPTATAPAATPAPAATSAPKPESVPDSSKGD